MCRNILQYVATNRRHHFTNIASAKCFKHFKLKVFFNRLRLYKNRLHYAKTGLAEIIDDIRSRLVRESFLKLVCIAKLQSSAITIQRISRGYLAQRYAWVEYVLFTSVVSIQSFYRQRLAMKKTAILVEKRENAAVEIQRITRGHISRRLATDMLLSFVAEARYKLQNEREKWIDQRREAASVKIQSIARVYIAENKANCIRQKINREYSVKKELQKAFSRYQAERRIIEQQLIDFYNDLRENELNKRATEKRIRKERVKKRIRERTIARTRIRHKEESKRRELEENEMKQKEAWIESWKQKRKERCKQYKETCRRCLFKSGSNNDKGLSKSLKNRVKKR